MAKDVAALKALKYEESVQDYMPKFDEINQRVGMHGPVYWEASNWPSCETFLAYSGPYLPGRIPRRVIVRDAAALFC